MTRIRALVGILVLILVLPVALAGCGDDGGGGDEDPSQVLDQTFNNSDQIDSGVLDLSFEGSAEGQGSLSAELSGPFEGLSDASRVPRLDWTGSVAAEGVGPSFSLEGGVTVTGDNAYVTYQGQAYEVGTRVFRQLERRYAQSSAQGQGQNGQSFLQACKQAVQQGGGDTSVCDIDLTGWLTDVTNEGTESVGGTDSIHVSGGANVKQIFSDLSGVVAQLPGPSAQGLTPAQLSQVESAVESATIDVYSGAEDKILRRLDFDLTLDLSALATGSAITIGTVDVTFSITFSDLNSAQTVSAPENPKPISELGIGDLGPLGSLGGGGVGGGGGPAPGYLDCIQGANTSDEIQQCAEELQ